MKVKNFIRACALPRRLDRGEGRGEVSIFAALLHRLTRILSFVARRNPPPAPPPVQLALDLDQITESGLPLREALPVRSAEYWLQLGAPDLALQELETLPEPVRQHDWPRRIRFAARLQLTQTS